MKNFFAPLLKMSTFEKVGFFALSVLVIAFMCIGSPEGVLMAAPGAELLRRNFLTEIMPKLFPANSWLQRATNDDSFVNGNSVELPHSGTIPAVQVDRASLPATIAVRTDVATNYLLEELTTDPTLLKFSEAKTVTYDKRASIIDQHQKAINTKAGSRALQKWAVGADTAHKIPSTGSARAAGNSNGSQTGNRKAFTLADITSVQRMFFKDDVTTEITEVNGVAVITPDQYNDLIKLPDFNQAQTYGSSNIPSGVMKRAFGFDFYVRSLVTVLDVSDVLKAEAAAGAATDQDAAVFYHPNYVRRAVGEIKPFLDIDKPEFYGSLFSMLVRFGANPARNDNKGVVLLFEDN